MLIYSHIGIVFGVWKYLGEMTMNNYIQRFINTALHSNNDNNGYGSSEYSKKEQARQQAGTTEYSKCRSSDSGEYLCRRKRNSGNFAEIENSKGKERRGRTSRKGSDYFSNSSSLCKVGSRCIQDCKELCMEIRESAKGFASFGRQAWKEGKGRIITTFYPIFYNPNIFNTLMTIDIMFTDEMIALNLIQLNNIVKGFI